MVIIGNFVLACTLISKELFLYIVIVENLVARADASASALDVISAARLRRVR